MKCCSSRCAAAECQFGPAIASRDLRRYQRKGPDSPSRLFLEALRAELKSGDSLLDVGAGVGVLDFELLAKGVKIATLVEASPAYLEAAEREGQSRSLTERLQFVVGDFTSVADTIARADVVTMHRVVCCYPDCASLLRAATVHAGRVLAFSYPRDRWYLRLWLAFENLRRRFSGSPFRTFVHSPTALDTTIGQAGFRRTRRFRTLVWAIDVYVRT